MTDDEKGQKLMEFSPRRQKPREIINVKELQNDFVENIHIKQEVEDPKEVPKEIKEDGKQSEDYRESKEAVVENTAKDEIKLPEVINYLMCLLRRLDSPVYEINL